ncbi:MAG: class I SAM-dependent methyltransferase [Actinomycetota bacterium]
MPNLPLRHNRTAEFADAWPAAPRPRWSSTTADPSDAAAIAHRGRVLAEAWMPTIENRIDFLADRCRGKRVLDIGCVAHDVGRFDDPSWLHRHLADAADLCVGVDILEPQVAAMNEAGFDVVAHDLSTGLGPLADRGPFDVIVAGELIEHLSDLDLLIRIADTALAPGGELVLTTPNPYAPDRVWAGQRGIVFENADHVSYLFPAGIAELAERNGLRLTGATTTAVVRARTPMVRRLKRFVKSSGWHRVGYTTIGRGGRQRVIADRPRVARWLRRSDARFVGETFVYVVSPRLQAR